MSQDPYYDDKKFQQPPPDHWNVLTAASGMSPHASRVTQPGAFPTARVAQGREVRAWPDTRPGTIIAFCDGSCYPNPDGPSGAGVFIEDGPECVSIAEPLGNGTNNTAELLAVDTALRYLGNLEGESIDIVTDSEYVIGLLALDWAPRSNTALVLRIRARLATFTDLIFVKVRGHKGVPGNEEADKLASWARKNQTRKVTPMSLADWRTR